MIPIPTSYKSAVRPVQHTSACSKSVIGIFSLFITSIAIVLTLVSTQPRRGVVNWLIKSIGSARKESCPEPILYASLGLSRFDVLQAIVRVESQFPIVLGGIAELPTAGDHLVDDVLLTVVLCF